MNRAVARNVSLVLMLAAFPLISVGATSGPDLLWWLGGVSLTLGALIPAALRFVPEPKKDEPPRPSATDMDSCRVC